MYNHLIETNGIRVSSGSFAGEPLNAQDELQQLANAINSGSEEVYVDEYGVAHIGDRSLTPNSTGISGDTFAGPSACEEEISNLAGSIMNNRAMFVDHNGVIHFGEDSFSENGARVSGKTFAGTPLNLQEITSIENELDSIITDSTNDVPVGGSFGVEVASTPAPADAETLFDGGEAPAPVSIEELGQVVGETGPVLNELGEVSLGDNAEPTQNGVRTMISGDTFAALPNHVPKDPEQWYNKLPALFNAEVAAMRTRFPNAGYGFLKSNNNMYWTVTLKISEKGFTKPWTFLLIYEKNHPNNLSYGGSVKVVPINPGFDELERVARANGRKGVPHVVNKEGFGKYLCTRATDEVEDGKKRAGTAVQAAAWAVDWAVHFEVSMKYKDVWNKWVDDAHYRSWKI